MKMTETLCLEWENLNLQVQKRHFNYFKCKSRVEQKKILTNVNGHIESGQLVAIIGASGAGKTSLLAAISKRYRGSIDGRVLLNGEPIGKKTITKLSCFVPQFNITIDSLTPNEHLYFMGELKLDRRWTRAQKDQRIQNLLSKLGLQFQANIRISLLSGGERKRLNLATDMLKNPPIIFCDEPTTGLDSYNALSVMKSLQQLTQVGTNGIDSNDNSSSNCSDEMELMGTRKVKSLPKAILCSIHQPNSAIFECFSHIILMYAGRTVFQGTRDEAITYFSSLGFCCPTSYNPADYYLKILSNGADSDIDIDAINPFDRPIDLLRKSFEHSKRDRHLMEPLFIDISHEHKKVIWIQQVWILLRRTCRRSMSNWRQTLITILISLIPYMVIAFAFRNVSARNQESIQDIRGALFMLVCQIVYSCAYGTLQFYPAQLPLLRRETNEHIYKFSAFYFAETMWHFQVVAIRSVGLMTVTNFMLGFFNGFESNFQLTLIVVFAAFTSDAYGFMLTGLFNAGEEVAPFFSLIFQVLGGFFINLHSFPYLRYVSVFFFMNEAMTTLYWYDITDIECPPDLNNNCLHNGTEVLDAFAYNTTITGVYYDYMGLVCLGMVMHTIAFVGIRRFVRSTGYY